MDNDSRYRQADVLHVVPRRVLVSVHDGGAFSVFACAAFTFDCDGSLLSAKLNEKG